MAITLVQSAEGLSSTITTNPSFAVAPTSGNLIVLCFASDDYNGTPNAGWTQSTGMEQQTFHGGYIWWRISNGSNPPGGYTIGSATVSSWVLCEFSGVDAAPYDISNGQFASSSANTYTTPSIVPTTGNRLLVAVIRGSNSSANLSVDLTTWLNSFTHVATSGQASGVATVISLAYRLVAGNSVTSYSSGATYPSSTPQARSGLIISFKEGAGGVTNYSTAGGLGTLTASGQAAKLARSRDMDAVNGTLTLSGPTVNLIYSGAGPKSMAGGIGFLSASGQAATLARSRKMASVNGTLTLSGQTAGLRGARKMASGVGILTLDGQANRLARSRKMISVNGTLTLSGPVVNLIKSGGGPKTLPAGLGFPLLGGQQAILRYTRKMPALTGTLTATGKLVVLIYVPFEGDIVMPASAGVLMMAGREASLNVRRAVQEVGKLEFGRKVYLRRW
jgi:hypothetical protein